MQKIIPLIALAIPCSATLASGVSIYNDRANFTIDAGSVNIETFENEALGQFAMPTVFSSGLSAALTSGAVSSLIEAGDPSGFGFQNTTDGGRNYLRMGSGGSESGSYTTAFTTQSAVRAFGFDISGFQPTNAANGFNLTLLNNGQLIDDIFVPSDQVFNEVRFFGFIYFGIDFDEVRVNIPILNIGGDPADHVAFDDVTWGQVPAPSTAALLALTGLAASRRRR